MKRLGLWVSYLLVLSLFVEGTSRVVMSQESLFGFPIMGIDETSWRLRWVREQKKEKFYFPTDRYDSRLGWFPKENLRNIEAINGEKVSTNNVGLRMDRDIKVEKGARERVLIFGDSFTFGDEAEAKDIYPNRLQTMFPNKEIINFGVHGYGHDQMLVLLKEQGLKYRPDLVILGYVSQDVVRNMVDFRSYAKPKYRLQAEGLELTNVPVPRPEDILARETFRPRFFDLLSVIQYRFGVRFGSFGREEREVTYRILDEFAESVERNGGRALFAFLPVVNELLSLENESLPSEDYFWQFCREKNRECLSTRSHFAQLARSGVKFRTDRHWGVNGHSAVAESIQNYLTRGGRGLASERK